MKTRFKILIGTVVVGIYTFNSFIAAFSNGHWNNFWVGLAVTGFCVFYLKTYEEPKPKENQSEGSNR